MAMTPEELEQLRRAALGATAQGGNPLAQGMAMAQGGFGTNPNQFFGPGSNFRDRMAEDGVMAFRADTGERALDFEENAVRNYANLGNRSPQLNMPTQPPAGVGQGAAAAVPPTMATTQTQEQQAVSDMAARGVVPTGPASFGRPELMPQQLPAGATANIDFSRPSVPLTPQETAPMMEAEQGQTVTRSVDGGSVTVPQSLAAQTFRNAPNAPMGVEATQRRLQEIFGTEAPTTLNQAITGNPEAVMAPDFQGRMRSFESPEAAAQNLTQGQAAFDAASQARQARIGGTGSFAGDSAAREDRLAARSDFNAPQASRNVPQDVREAINTDPSRRTAAQVKRLTQWEGSTQGKQMGGVQGLQAEAQGEGRTEDLPERERRVESLMDTTGISRREALGLVEGTTRIQSDPTTGNAVIVDMVTGETKPLDMAPDMQQQLTGERGKPEEGGEPSTTLAKMARESTGVWNSMKTIGQRVVGQAGVTLGNAPEIINMRQNVGTAQQQLIRALSINPRFPVSEQERIKEEIDISPSAWNDPVTIQSKMEAVDDALRDRLEDEVQAHQNKSLPRNTRQAALQAANDISNFLELLGVPEDAEERKNKGAESSDIDAIAQKYLNQ